MVYGLGSNYFGWLVVAKARNLSCGQQRTSANEQAGQQNEQNPKIGYTSEDTRGGWSGYGL